MARVEGDMTVKQLSEIETKDVVVEASQSAQDEFRKVSRYQKAVDGKRPVRPAVVASRLAEASPAAVPRPVTVAQPEPETLLPLAASVAAAAAAANAATRAKDEVAAPTAVKTEALRGFPSRPVHNSAQGG